jgi:hypothetical protein
VRWDVLVPEMIPVSSTSVHRARPPARPATAVCAVRIISGQPNDSPPSSFGGVHSTVTASGALNWPSTDVVQRHNAEPSYVDCTVKPVPPLPIMMVPYAGRSCASAGAAGPAIATVTPATTPATRRAHVLVMVRPPFVARSFGLSGARRARAPVVTAGLTSMHGEGTRRNGVIVMGMRVVAVLGLLAALLSPATSHAATPHASGWVLTRTGPGPTLLDGTMHAEARGSGAVVKMFALKPRGAAHREEWAFSWTTVLWGTEGWVAAYDGPVLTPPCVAATCDDPVRTPADVNFHANGRKIAGAVYFAAWDADVTLTLRSPGWRARRWTPTMHLARIEEGGGTGVRVAHTNYGTFREVSLPGGRYGSTANAMLPCKSSGEGRGRFTGGPRPHDLTCGIGAYGFDEATKATRWRLKGESDGMSGSMYALVVVDYPRP